MAIEYLGLSEINGPLVVLEGVQNAAYDEIVEMTVAGNLHKIGPVSYTHLRRFGRPSGQNVLRCKEYIRAPGAQAGNRRRQERFRQEDVYKRQG